MKHGLKRHLQTRFENTRNKLAFKIPFAYFIVIILTVTVSCVILYRISSEAAQNKVNEASVKTITSVKTNVELMLQNINNYSKMMLSDNNLQSLLRNGNVYSNLQTQGKVSNYFYNLFQAEPMIDSVYIFDREDNCFSVGQYAATSSTKHDVKEATWYKRAIQNDGKPILVLNGGGLFNKSSAGNFVSFIRLIRDVDNTSSLGVMAINLPGFAFVQAYKNIGDENELQVVILDENNEMIVPENSNNGNVQVFEEALGHEKDLTDKLEKSGSGYMIYRGDTQSYLISYVSDGAANWKYVSIMPYHNIGAQNSSLVFLAVLLLLIDGVIFYVSSFLISRNIISPVRQLLQSMKSADFGRFNEIEDKPNSHEFEHLFRGYNKMIRRINELLERILQEQKIIRKAELNTLQAQIKPHFLYNTLDSIASLALSGCNEEVCFLVDSLGNYYRNSVSKGKEIISVGEEIDIVRNYLNIQKVRYRDLFDVEYEVERETLEYPILKLILQPLVENALYHGIRQKGEHGVIRVTAREMGDTLVISVADDGVGMAPEEIEQILENEREGKVKSFGLRGTMERVRIYYGDANCVRIESVPGAGTTITLTIPKGVDLEWNSSKC